MDTIYHEQLLARLNWRYATKQFDPRRKINREDLTTLEEALVLTPSSFGLQPWEFVVVSDPKTKKQLLAASWGQRQVEDCSHLFVFATRNISEKEISEHIARIAAVRGIPRKSLDSYHNLIVTTVLIKLDDTQRNQWAACQVYIALGNFLNSAALLGIDVCPMEGIDRGMYDQLLKLQPKGLRTMVVAASGYRSADDQYALLKKVRFPRKQLFLEV